LLETMKLAYLNCVCDKRTPTPEPTYGIDSCGNTIVPNKKVNISKTITKKIYKKKCIECAARFKTTFKNAKYCMECSLLRQLGE